MQDTPKPDLKALLFNAIKEKVFSNKDLTDDQKIEMTYSAVVSSLQGLIAATKLELRILRETKALEDALGKHIDKFHVVLTAKPMLIKPSDPSQFKEDIIVDSTPAEGSVTSEAPSTEGGTGA